MLFKYKIQFYIHTNIRNLIVGCFAILCFICSGPTAVLAYDVEFQYGVKPNDTVKDTLVNNQATMQAQGGSLVSSNTVCTQVGSPQTGNKCNTSSSELVKAAQNLYDAIVTCTSSKGIDLYGSVMQAGKDCMTNQLKGKYADDKISIALNGAVANASGNTWYQCVGFVEDALTLVGTIPGPFIWNSGAQFWTKLPPGYDQLTDGPPQPGHIITHDVNAGHVGIVKSVKSYDPITKAGEVILLDQNADSKGGETGKDGGGGTTGDISDTHVAAYDFNKIANANANRFLRKRGTTGDQPGSDIAQKLQNDFGVTAIGYTDTFLQWVYDKLSDTKGTNLLKLATANTGGKLLIQNPTSNTGKNPGYNLEEGWSYTPGCANTGSKDSPHIWLVDKWPKASDADRHEYLNITLMHEIGHIIQKCGGVGALAAEHAGIFNGGKGAFSYYSQNANTPGCPKDVDPLNEDYADMIGYYLNPSTNQKLVCDNQTSRPANPYNNSSLANTHKDLAKQILGTYP